VYGPNSAAFDSPLSKEAAYWIGFLLADGCVIDRGSGNTRIQLGLHIKDAEHVRKFARFIGIDENRVREFSCPNHLGECHGAAVSFAGKELGAKLAEYGIIPRKSMHETVHVSLSDNPDFWRGLVDGDGSLGNYEIKLIKKDHYLYPRIALCGSRQVVENFSAYLYTITGFKPSITSNKHCVNFTTALGGTRAKTAISVMYYDGCCPVLDRKMVVAVECKSYVPRKVWLTRDEILFIRNSVDSCYSLAKKFAISPSAVQRIRRSITYKNI
jgi:hypothetical protein